MCAVCLGAFLQAVIFGEMGAGLFVSSLTYALLHPSPLTACAVNACSMNAEKLDRARKAKALRVAQTEEGMLGTFVRLVDYVCVEMIAAGVTSQLRLFLRELIGACPAAFFRTILNCA